MKIKQFYFILLLSSNFLFGSDKKINHEAINSANANNPSKDQIYQNLISCHKIHSIPDEVCNIIADYAIYKKIFVNVVIEVRIFKKRSPIVVDHDIHVKQKNFDIFLA